MAARRAPPLRETLDSTFQPDATNPWRAGITPVLELSVGNTPWIDAVMGRFFALMGIRLEGYIEDGNDPSARAKITAWREREGVDLRVEAELDGKLQPVALVPTVGPMSLRRVAIPLPAAAASSGKTLHVRVSGGLGFWRVDEAALSWQTALDGEPRHIAPTAARDPAGRDWREALRAIDGTSHVLADRGDRLDLSFELPPVATGRIRTAFVFTHGYYNVHRPPNGDWSPLVLKEIRDCPGARGVRTRPLPRLHAARRGSTGSMTAASLPVAPARTPLIDAADGATIRPRIWSDVWRIAQRIYGDQKSAAHAVGMLAARLGDVRAARHEKCVKIGGRYFFDLNCPGWPSPAFEAYLRTEVARFLPFPDAPASLQTLMFAITKKCPLQCEHCSEWEGLNGRETLTRGDLLAIAARFQDRGIPQMQLSGGEPLRRFDDLLDVVRAGSSRTDFWLLTSGHGLTDERAQALRAAGLTGVQVSIDHWQEAAHDRFRGRTGSFVGLPSCDRGGPGRPGGLSQPLCDPRDGHRRKPGAYAALAADLGAGFIQILEPRAVGRYRDRDVLLSGAQEAELEEFFVRANQSDDGRAWPIVTYLGYGQRRLGCPSAGDRFLFIDSDGRAQVCPFCPGAVADCRDEAVEDVLTAARGRGCGKYPAAVSIRARRGATDGG